MSALHLKSTVRLNNGVEIPRVGLGVYQARRGDETRQAVLHALQAGYRHVDTARIYGNERDVGEALRESGLPRDEVFITTKLWNQDQGHDSTLRACERSLRELGLEYVDLYLIHWPVPSLRLDSWRAMEKLLADGKCRAIGVSNFLERHLDELMAHSKVVPAINQVELSPFLAQETLRAYCQRHGIVVEAYSPLTRGQRLDDPRLGAVAKRHGKTAAQVLIRWCLQRDLVVLPKSVHPTRIRENAAVFDFDLSPEDLNILDGLDEELHTSWDPSDVP
ncbi:aldo/keto reductase [Pyxidicoccus fallax]|uniref:Aldo/keto reductase n=1 Tax=Pyxidicoccus fallax TaxID=394095 RepID=A0A848LXI5_9BACT|nr:aldo/keto reductase [Pyxidicoccus fallax]NMO22331.1 aldo/keto reductase [Pyxidicoccus fallax]NPC84029.1 aldo/keto reductase [Pyxidicoccus fallax]